MIRTLFFRVVASILVLTLVLPGCATMTQGPTHEMRASFGTIGVSRALYPPDTGFIVPAKGRPEGSAAAFAAVMEGGLQGGPHGMTGEAAGDSLLFLFAMATAATPVGAVVGVVRAMPGAEAASSEARTRKILKRMKTQEVLRGEVLRVVIEETGRNILPVDEVGPASVDNVANYGSLSGSGIDTVLEIALLRIVLESDTWGSDPPLAFTMSARCRLLRVADGTVLDDHEYRAASPPRKFSQWTVDNGALLGRESGKGWEEWTSP